MFRTSDNDWFIPFKQKYNSSIRLFCFHYGGGSASAFRDWSKDLTDFVELIAIQMPGRENRFNDPPISDISIIVDKLCNNIDRYLDKPFIFFGHSIGALIAFECTRALRRRGMVQPKHLIASGTRAPQIPLNRQPINNLPESKFIEELKKYNGIPSSIIEDKELISLFLPTLRADFCISENYTYSSEEPLNCPITALGGTDDYTFDFNNLLKWEAQTSNAFKYYFLPGDHFFIRNSYKEIMKIVNQILYDEIVGS